MKRKTLWLMGIMGGVVIAAGAGGAWWIMQQPTEFASIVADFLQGK